MPKKSFRNLSPEKQEEIRRIALQEFVSRGYRNASTNTIVEHLGIAKGSLFYYFEGKEDLYRYLVQDAHAKISRGMSAAVKEWPGDILERIRVITRAGIDLLKSMPLEYRLLSGLLDQESAALRNGFLAKLGADSMAQFHSMFHGVDTVRFRFSEEETVSLVQWVYMGIKLELNQLMETRENIEVLEKQLTRRVDTALKLLEKGIYKPVQPSPGDRTGGLRFNTGGKKQ